MSGIAAARAFSVRLLVVCVPIVCGLIGAMPMSADAAAVPMNWCGGEWSTADRLPEGTAGRQVHVIVAVPLGRSVSHGLTDRVVTDVAAIDGWWRAQDPSRAPRFDTYAFGACASAFGRLDVSHVHLPGTLAHYAIDRWARITAALRTSGFTNSYKKYLVYYDAPLVGTESIYCGQGGDAFALVFVGACPQDLGTGGFQAALAAHELGHTLGAVSSTSAPHKCADSGHVCGLANDLMNPRVPKLSTAILDVGRDDYYGHSGGWLDIQDSPWLSHLDGPQFQLTAAVRGSGGEVRSDEPGISCPDACAATWDAGTRVTLRANAPAGSKLIRWDGSCAGTSTSCVVELSEARSATAVIGTPPVARIGALAPTYQTGQDVSLVSASSDSDGSIVDTAWDFGDGAVASGSSATHSYAARGTYTVTLTVTDDLGATAAATTEVVVRVAPEAALGAIQSSYSFGAPVSFTSTVQARDGTVQSIVWDFGDGTTANGPTAIHSFPRPGSYTVALTVTDDVGATGRAQAIVRIVDSDAPRVTARVARARVGKRVALFFEARDDYMLGQVYARVYRGSKVVRAVRIPVSGSRAASRVFARIARLGRHRWCVRSSDAAGNMSAPSCAPIRISKA